MDYAKYKGLRDASWRCLIECKITSLPVKIGNIAQKYGISVIYDRDVDILHGSSGRIYRIENDIYIVVNDSESRQRRRFTVAHELGHFLLGHLGSDISQLNRARQRIKPEAETQADMFAARLLAPACVLWGLQLSTAQEIATICDISLESAGYRAKRMAELYKRNCFLKSPVEKQLFEQFNGFIKQNRR